MNLIKTGIKPIDDYCESVKTGKRSVCRWVRLAVDRHYKDLERWGLNHYDKDNEKFERKPEGKYYFDPAAAEYYASFFEDNLSHYDGVFAGNPFKFEPWQWFAKASPFGWLKYERINDMPIRRFRSLDIFIPKKQGKSAWIGGNMLFFLEYDNYPGAQIYSLALNQSHAKELGYRDAEIMVENSPTLDYQVKKGAAFAGIYHDANNAHIKPLVNNEQIADGPKIHVAANDEIKDWRNKELYETLINGTASDPTAMVINISTAGTDKQSLGFDRYKYVKDLLEGTIKDETAFGIIYGIDEEDKEKDGWWKDIKLYKKANPNFGVTVGEDYYKSRINSAVGKPNKIASLKCKHLNEWVSSLNGFVTSDVWKPNNKGEVSIDDFTGRKVHMAMDLGEVSDFTCFGLLGEPTDPEDDYIVKMWYWIPRLTLRDRENSDIIEPWCGEWIITTVGNATDYDTVEEDIKEIIDHGLQVSELHFDPNKGQQIPQHLVDYGIEPIAVAQTYRNLNPGVEEMERLLLKQRINFGGDPVLAWMNSNVVVTENKDEYRKFDKRESQDKIDGMVVLEMLFAKIASQEDEPEQYYDGEFVAV